MTHFTEFDRRVSGKTGTGLDSKRRGEKTNLMSLSEKQAMNGSTLSGRCGGSHTVIETVLANILIETS